MKHIKEETRIKMWLIMIAVAFIVSMTAIVERVINFVSTHCSI